MFNIFSSLVGFEDEISDFQFKDYDKALGVKFNWTLIQPFWSQKNVHVKRADSVHTPKIAQLHNVLAVCT